MSNSTSTDSGNSGFQKYPYDPSEAAAIIFTVLFALTTSLHAFQLISKRTWFMIPFFIGGILEIVGYIGRVIAATEAPGPYETGPYIVQTITLLVAPALFAASIYMQLGRIVLMLKADDKLFIRRTWVTKIFVAGDVASFLLQAAGGGLSASDDSNTSKLGKDIIIVGLFVQIVFFGLFVVVAALFNIRLNKNPTPSAHTLPWKKHMYTLYAVSILIFVRSIVRVVEFIQGFEGYIYSHEVFLYVFDATMMFIAMGIMNVVHPGEVAVIVRGQLQGEKDVESGSELVESR
ncbi:hypothetical protein M409DRAFT_16982 [Zasmidium cellare ATCC 36951]|uniref:RTA1 like protein n=1 Tax=Zasmidium cellare ATCC 36951 TaxID=1080233 RepID=A0A6A6D4A7_ZASCE|nr:uncharacterized protein M409DRAFT_16982 [Zasmidium cellare ATCC 36951]KAF2173032.1 hypothetical protein M409DRAFT_16982 [Zasmidium cellare ATCC 36951]